MRGEQNMIGQNRGGEVTGGEKKWRRRRRRSSCRGAWRRRNPRDGRRARLSARGDRLSSSLLISAFNTLNNWLAAAHRLGTAGVVREGVVQTAVFNAERGKQIM